MPAATDNTLLSIRHFTSRLPARASLLLFLVPLLNVLFLLLIFVMIGSSVLPLPGEVIINLPTVETPAYATADKYVITMKTRHAPDGSRRGDIFFNNTPVSDFNQLENALPGRRGEQQPGGGVPWAGTVSAGDQQPVIILRADKDITLQELTTVMDICRRKDCRLLIVTEQRKP